MPNNSDLKITDEHGAVLTPEALKALPVGTVIYIQRGNGPRVPSTKTQ